MMTKSKPPANSTESELTHTLGAIKQYFLYVGAFSAAVNMLMLVPIIYMLQIYERVISSGSLSTLTMLTILMVCLLAASGGFDWVRTRILISASNRIEQELRQRVVSAAFKQALLGGGQGASAQPVGDLTGLRQFLTGSGLFAFFDAPWFPIYVAIMFLFHPWFGVAAIVAGIVMVMLAFTNEKLTNKKLQDANAEAGKAGNQLNGSLRNAEVIAAMGMTDNIHGLLDQTADKVIQLQTNASKQASILTSLTKTFRITMQSLVLGLGALLALNQEISPGMMIAGSLLLGRALAPIDQLVATWKGFSVARAQYKRLEALLEKIPPEKQFMELPEPTGALTVTHLTVVPPGSKTAVVRGASFALVAGESLAIVGPSASGKSSLARAVLGVWPAYNGSVRIDGADIANWDRVTLGPYLGYLPQDIELFDGSISQNICRFGQIDPEKIVAAAKLAGVHEMILHLPEGYDTIIGGNGGMLSAGQRQRIGLARAVYDDPRLIVLDEPNSNLDEQGEKELIASLLRIKAKGCTVIIITHRTSVLSTVDKMLVMQSGAITSFGSREEVMASLMAQSQQAKPVQGSAAVTKNDSAA